MEPSGPQARSWIAVTRRAALAASVAVFAAGAALAQIAPERASVARLAPTPEPHWLWVSTLSLGVDGSVHLLDADRGRALGMISTGYFSDTLAFAPDHAAIYAVETYFSRGTRGTRTDVVTVYDPASLAPVDEIVIPPRRAVGFPMPNKVALGDDGRFLWIYNYTPAQSVAVVDVKERRYAGEIETAGCALVYPSGARRFHMLCGDGTLLTVRVDDAGRLAGKSRSERFFDPRRDPVTEKAVRAGPRWLFASVGGLLHAVDGSGAEPVFDAPWSLLDDADRAGGWAIGGNQHLAAHAPSGTLYSVVHQGEAGTYKQPGGEIWVYDLAKRRRTARFEPRRPVQSVEVSQDAEPLLFTAFMGAQQVDVYDAKSGDFVRSIPGILLAPNLMQVPWRGARAR